jgi:NDP-hexose-3-ketoreductase
MRCKIVNIGVVGAASIAIRSVIPAISSLSSQFKIAGIASRDLLKAKSASLPYNCNYYGSYEDLLSDPSIDAVYIPLPNSLHFRFVIMALENGKHVLVEKSLGCKLDEVKIMVAAASANKRVLLENFQFRFHSQLQAILQLLKDGTIGDLRSIRISFGFPTFSDSNNIRYIAELGGGALLDAGAYALKIAPFFLGEDITLAHSSMVYDRIKGVDILGEGVLVQRNGPLFCHFAYGFDNHYQCSLELWGSVGKLTTNRIFTAPAALQPMLLIETQQGIEDRILPADDHFRNILEYFHALILGTKSPFEEYNSNIQQAVLIHDFQRLAIKHYISNFNDNK